MASSLDLWTIMRSYSLKNNMPTIDLGIFAKFLSRNAARPDFESLSDWTENTEEKIQEAVKELVLEGKCKVLNEAGVQKILLPHFFVDKIDAIHQISDGIGDKPFPDEKSLRLAIPHEYVRTIPVEPSLVNYLNNPQVGELPILKLSFPKGFGDGFTLASLLPRRVLELSILKIKESFRKDKRVDFYSQKCLTHFPGQEARVKEFMGLLMTRTVECADHIEEASEFSFGFWLFICPLIKTQIQDNIDRTSETDPSDIALFQAATIILILSNYYKIIAINIHNKELVLAEIDSKLTEPPYYFTMSDIRQFKNKNGIVLLQKISEDDFKNFISKKMSSDKPNVLPDILTYSGPDKTQWFVRKDRVWPLIEMLIKEGTPVIRDEIVIRWTGILKNYRRERAMDKDQNFEELVKTLSRELCPVLISILHERKTAILQNELCSNELHVTQPVLYFDVDIPIPMRKLFRYNRSEILQRTRYELPFWYSLSFVVFFMNIAKHGATKKYVDDDKKKKKKGIKEVDVKTEAENYIGKLVPKGSNVDDYMLCVLDRWNLIVSKPAHDKLTNDVEAIVKAHLRHLEKMGRIILSDSMLTENANRIINMNSALAKIKNREALVLYIKLSITKLLMWS
jgi:hypothetical protein